MWLALAVVLAGPSFMLGYGVAQMFRRSADRRSHTPFSAEAKAGYRRSHGGVVSDLNWSPEQVHAAHDRYQPFADFWDAHGMDAYDAPEEYSDSRITAFVPESDLDIVAAPRTDEPKRSMRGRRTTKGSRKGRTAGAGPQPTRGPSKNPPPPLPTADDVTISTVTKGG